MSTLDLTLNRVAESAPPFEPAPPFDREYWLAHCEGYRVETPGGRVGFVEEVRQVVDGGRPESLAVLAGCSAAAG